MLYVSPLKALGNDIQKNLDGPLSEILELALRKHPDVQEIRTAVRTGDTLMPDRRAMIKRPPHIVVTTPESLYILLTSASGRDMLATVETAIVDEIHAVADDKRGAHLALSLERLDALVGRTVPRIGLSATVTPIDVIAAYLSGAGRPCPHRVQSRAAAVRPRDRSRRVKSRPWRPTSSGISTTAWRRSSANAPLDAPVRHAGASPNGSLITSPPAWAARTRCRASMATSRGRPDLLPSSD